MCVVVACAVVQAIQCSSGGECPSDGKPQNIVSLLQTQHQMNVVEDGGEVASAGTNTDTISEASSTGTQSSTDHKASIRSDDSIHKLMQNNEEKEQYRRQRSIKLIVNSDVRYSAPLQALFDSLDKVSFNRWNDVIVMRGSASNNSDPFTPDTKYGKLGVKYINLELSSFDYHGLSGLHSHHNDPHVKADVYFYIHDTVLANSTFPRKFDLMASTDKFEARHPPFPFNNICVFGSGVVETYGGQFDAPVTKERGIWIERDEDNEVRNVVTFAKTQTLLEKMIRPGNTVDVYHTGYPRGALYFPSYGITKYGFWGRFGDLTGNIQDW